MALKIIKVTPEYTDYQDSYKGNIITFRKTILGKVYMLIDDALAKANGFASKKELYELENISKEIKWIVIYDPINNLNLN